LRKEEAGIKFPAFDRPFSHFKRSRKGRESIEQCKRIFSPCRAVFSSGIQAYGGRSYDGHRIPCHDRILCAGNTGKKKREKKKKAAGLKERKEGRFYADNAVIDQAGIR
jgi:hypothetical protein